MHYYSDFLLIFAVVASIAYSLILARRLKAFSDLDNGIGDVIDNLSSQVEKLRQTIDDAQNSATRTNVHMTDLTHRAETASHKLELLLASMHDLPKSSIQPTQTSDTITAPIFFRKAT